MSGTNGLMRWQLGDVSRFDIWSPMGARRASWKCIPDWQGCERNSSFVLSDYCHRSLFSATFVCFDDVHWLNVCWKGNFCKNSSVRSTTSKLQLRSIFYPTIAGRVMCIYSPCRRPAILYTNCPMWAPVALWRKHMASLGQLWRLVIIFCTKIATK